MSVLHRNKRIVIVGATSAIAEHCARLWVTDAAVDVVLVGRDMEKTEMVAADLRVRSPHSAIRCEHADFHAPRLIAELADRIVRDGPVDIVLIAHGSLPDQQQCQADLDACQAALSINAVSPVLFAEAFAGHMQRAGAGVLAIIGSVAGDRGRKSNYVYGAAKGLVSRYAQGLQHRLANSGVKVVLIKPGPTDTPMTAQLKMAGGRLADVLDVAQQIVDGVKGGSPVVYAPRKWRLIMWVIRHLPAIIFNRLNI